MGVTGIWDYMTKHCESVGIDTLRNKTVAVDGHIWLVESSKGCSAYGVSGASYLVTFFNRCQRLRENGIEPVVVFDHIEFQNKTSTHSAIIKKSRRGGGNNLSTTVSNDIFSRVLNVKTLLEHMGIRCLVGESDGEAQCAQLEMAGLVHGCITTDFDYFLFGGRKLFKVEFSNGGRTINTRIMHLSMDKLESNTLNFNRYRLVALAMLLGCDYMEGGIGGVGIITALEIVSEFSLHEDDHTITILDRFACYHRQEVETTHETTNSNIRKGLRSRCKTLPVGFPNTETYCDTANVYLVPGVKVYDKANFPAAKDPNIKSISDILSKECHWAHEKTAKEMNRSQNKLTAAKKVEHMKPISDFFPPTRRRSNAVVEACPVEDIERRKCSQREWAALQLLVSKSQLYKPRVSAETIILPNSSKDSPAKRPNKRRLGALDTPSTSTKRKQNGVVTEMATCSSTSSIIIIES